MRYAERDGHYLAFSVFGAGAHDIVVMQSRFPVDLMWELPQLADFMEALGRLARVIVFDARGSGGSDQVVHSDAQVESQVDDMLAVMDAADSDRATVFDMTSGYNALTIAALYPERIRSIIVVNLRHSFPELQHLSLEQRMKFALRMGTIERLRWENPRTAHDLILQRWWGRAARLLSSPARAAENVEVAAKINTDGVLPAVRVPTLVLHRQQNRVYDIEISRAAASRIAGARFVELPGTESDIFLGDTAPVLAEIERFVDEPTVQVTNDRPLATVLFTDIVASTELLAAQGDEAWRALLDDLDRRVDELVAAYRGRIVKQTGDGILATFDGPARAVRCAAALVEQASEHGITLRAGLHTGEIETRTSDIAGIAVHTANRIAAIAEPSEVLVSRTVVDLTAGANLPFEPRGEHTLKGVPGSWQLYSFAL